MGHFPRAVPIPSEARGELHQSLFVTPDRVVASRGMRVLVTGGAGFIGSHVAQACLDAGHEVTIVDNMSCGSRRNLPRDAAFFEVDIRDPAALRRVFADSRPQVVSHQAAQASVYNSTLEPTYDAEVNIIGSLNVLNAAVEHGVERFIFASTGGAIYGEVPAPRSADEGCPTRPRSPYACSKLAIEQYLRFYELEKGLRSCALRYANVYGPRQSPHGECGVVAIFGARLLSGEPIRIHAMRAPGDGGCIRDYVYITDVVRANMVAIGGKLVYPCMNVCTGIGTSTADLGRKLRRICGSRSPIVDGECRPGDVMRSVLSPDLCSTLGPITPLDDGLEDTVNWLRAS